MDTELSFLVVEDDPIDAKRVSRLLDHGGLSQHTDNASSLDEAKQQVRRRRYDAVILDLGLPDSQGIDGVIEFQATAPELPIVVLTGCQDENTALLSMDIGAEDFLIKDSMTQDSLCRSLRYAIERHRRKSEAYRDIDTLRLSLDDARREATTDPLTGLPNRRGLEQYLSHLRRAQPRQPFIVGVADLDHFKSINDSFGHHMGDMVLREFAGRLQHCLRSADFAARVGGDEFVIVFGGLGRSAAAGLGRRMLAHVSSSPAEDAGKSIPFSATLAMAEADPASVDLEQILQQTHELLARGKDGGRNRVECAWGEDGLPQEAEAPQAEEGNDFSENHMAQLARAVQTLGTHSGAGYHLLFGLGAAAWPMAAPAVSRARMANRLSEMTLACLRRAQEWRVTEAPGAFLHLDIEADAVTPQLCTELLRIFPEMADRENCVLFLHTDFHSQTGAAVLTDLRLLKQSGFQIGVRNIGDGATILERLQLLAPDWIRFDPALTINVGRYEKKASGLRQLVEILAPLKAKFAADEVESEEDLKLLEKLGFHSIYTKI